MLSGDSIHWSEDSKRLFFIIVCEGLQPIATIDLHGGNFKVIASERRHVSKLAVTRDRLVFAGASPGCPTELFVCNHDGSDQTRLSDLNGWWKRHACPITCLKSFDVPDGKGGSEQVDGWLMLPPADRAGPYPLLVDIFCIATGSQLRFAASKRKLSPIFMTSSQRGRDGRLSN
ncbi:hypothetical protein [Pararhizobium sp. DWP3-4]|uniref:hypothetical protein n=1 Tax=Pararhizobium sp. DWP3-4 TaxID=2804565 RepID=UPI003CE8CD31